jgi:serine protease Do
MKTLSLRISLALAGFAPAALVRAQTSTAGAPHTIQGSSFAAPGIPVGAGFMTAAPGNGITTMAAPMSGNIMINGTPPRGAVTLPGAPVGGTTFVNVPMGGITIAGAPLGGAPMGGSYHFTQAGFPAGLPTEEMESVTFLGIEASRVSAPLASQLSLAEGTGLLVTSVEAGSPAAAVFKPHDVLLKLDDQILIVQVQLSVLIRGHRAGDEVSISYLRAGRPAVAKIKLGQHEVPKVPMLPEELALSGGMIGFAPNAGGSSFAVATPATFSTGGMPPGRREADHFLSTVPRGPGAEPMMQMQVENRGAPGMSAVAVDPANSRLAYNDESGSMELTIKDSKKSLVAKDTKGAVLFSGPVNTPEERKAMPAAVLTNLERLEAMQNSSFRTDDQFRGTESRVILPQPRSI